MMRSATLKLAQLHYAVRHRLPFFDSREQLKVALDEAFNAGYDAGYVDGLQETLEGA